MTLAWHQMAPDQRALAGGLFEALNALDEAETPSERPVGFSELYAFAERPEQELSPRLAAALRDQPGLAADLRHLLAKGCAYHGPRQAAASTAALRHREGPGFALDICPSRADDSQVYVIIRLGGPAPMPAMLFVTRPDTEFHKHPLPSPAGDRLQLLFDADAEIVQALQDPASEVLLR